MAKVYVVLDREDVVGVFKKKPNKKRLEKEFGDPEEDGIPFEDILIDLNIVSANFYK